MRTDEVRIADCEPPVSSDWPVPSAIDMAIPAPARVYDYLLGGKNHFAADRAVGDQLELNVPQAVRLARDNRRFLHRAVRFMVANGITQFLDIGPGFPASPRTDEIALQAEPGGNVVYVDNDPLVITRTRALLKNARVGAVHLDVREPRLIFESPEVRSLIDLSRPVGAVAARISPRRLPRDLHRYRPRMAGRGPWQLAAGLARAARFPHRRRDQPGIRGLEARRAGASGHRRLEARQQRAIPA
jgi:hypothetical protein